MGRLFGAYAICGLAQEAKAEAARTPAAACVLRFRNSRREISLDLEAISFLLKLIIGVGIFFVQQNNEKQKFNTLNSNLPIMLIILFWLSKIILWRWETEFRGKRRIMPE